MKNKQTGSEKAFEGAELGKTIEEIVEELKVLEKKQDEALSASRQIIRDCANAIKHLHTGELAQARKAAKELETKIMELKGKVGGEFSGITHPIYQEYTEIMALLAVHERKHLPTYRQLGVPAVSYLNGLADAVGELRRALQIALKNGDEKAAEYFYEKMNEIYENLMLVKFSSSIVRELKRKQDVARQQLEQARSELLRAIGSRSK